MPKTSASRADRPTRSIHSSPSQSVALNEAETPREFLVGIIRFLYGQWQLTRRVADDVFDFISRFNDQSDARQAATLDPFGSAVHWHHLGTEKSLIRSILACHGKWSLSQDFGDLPPDWSACSIAIDDVLFVVLPNPDEVGQATKPPRPRLVVIEGGQMTDATIADDMGLSGISARRAG